MENTVQSLLSETDKKDLQMAKRLLEHPGLAIKITNLIGLPIEKGIENLPRDWNEKIGKITRSALLKASQAAIFTMKDQPGKASWDKLHTVGVATSGAVGGFFGIIALAVELPVSTTIMLRSIAEIARSYGESVSNPETGLACLEVFAIGGRSKSDESSESGYYAVRTLLAKTVSEAAKYIAERGLTEEGAPVLVRLISLIAQRFGIQISEKIAAMAIPVIGAAGGAIINTIFMDHFQDMARGHFIVRRLERAYGRENIKKWYNELPDNLK